MTEFKTGNSRDDKNYTKPAYECRNVIEKHYSNQKCANCTNPCPNRIGGANWD